MMPTNRRVLWAFIVAATAVIPAAAAPTAEPSALSQIQAEMRNRRFEKAIALADERVIVYNEYKAILKSYQNTCFDPFCRRARVYVDTSLCAMALGPVGGDVIETTNGQLNFFRWAISRGVLLYAGTLLAEIERDLAHHTRGAKAERQRDASILFAASTCITFT